MGLAAKKALVSLVLEEETDAELPDPNFKDTILLLKGDGSEGQGNTADLGNPSYKAFEDGASSAHDVIVNGDAYGNDFSPYYYADGYWSFVFDHNNDAKVVVGDTQTHCEFGYEDFQIDCMIYSTRPSSDSQGFFGTQATNVSSTGWRLQYDGTNIDWNHGTSNIHTFAFTFTPNTWFHFVIQRVSGTFKIFIDGVEKISTSDTTNYGASTDLTLGNGGNTGAGEMSGYLSNLRVITGASSTTSKITTPFTDPSVAGEMGVEFQGNGDYLIAGPDSKLEFDNNQFSVEWWEYRPSVQSFDIALQLSEGGDSYSMLFGYNRQVLYASSAGSSWDVLNDWNMYGSYTSKYGLNKWTHICVTRDSSGNIRAFIDGVMTNNTNIGTSTNIYQEENAVCFASGQGYSQNHSAKITISNARICIGSIPTDYQTSSTTNGTSIFTPSTSPFTTTSQGATNVKLLALRNKTFIDDSDSPAIMRPKSDTRISEFGPFGDGYWSNYFDGDSDSLEIANSTDFKFGTGDFTIECWLFPTVATQQSYGLVVKCAADSNWVGGWAIAFQNSPNNGKISFWVNNSQLIGSGTALNQNRWNHIAVTRSGSTTNLYQNGSRVATATNSYDFQPTQALTIASDLTHTAYEYQGYIKDLRILKGTALYTGTSYTQPTTNLEKITNTVLLTCQSNRFFDNSDSEHTVSLGDGTPQVSELIPFELLSRQTKIITSQGNRFKDIIPNRYDFVGSGNAKVSTKSPFTVTKTENVGSGYFDGNADVIYVDESSSEFTYGTGDYEFSCWVYRTVIGAQQTLFGRNSTGNTNVPYIYITSGNKFAVYYGSVIAASTIDVPSHSWCHLVASRVGGVLKLFQDGVEVSSVTNTTSLIASGKIAIGNQHTGGTTNALTGFIADARVRKGSGVTSVTVPTTSLTAETGTELLTCQYSGAVRNVGFLDDSKYNHLITRNGDVSMGTFSPFSLEDGYWSNSFDGSDYLSCSLPSGAFGTGDFTIEYWVYHNTLTNWQTHFATTRGGAGFNLGTDASGDLVFYSSSARQIEVIGAIETHRWYHWAFVRESGTVKAYVDGTQVGSASITTNFTDTTLHIGALNPAGEYVNGYMSNLRVVIGSAVYTSDFTPSSTPSTSTGSATKLLTCQSNRFVDNSLSPLTISVASDPKVQPFSPFAPSRSYSKDAVGGSGLFDGSGDYLSTSYKNDFAVSAPFTFEAWIYPRSIASGENNIVATELDGGSNGGVVLGIKGSGTNIYLATQAAGYTVDIGSQTIKPYEWSHIAAVVNGTGSNETDIYLNGTRVGQGTYNSTFSGNYATFIGQDGRGNGYFNGYIFNPRISTSARYSGASFTHLTAPISSDNNTLFLSKFDNAGIIDHTMKNNLETEGNVRISTIQKKFGTGSINGNTSSYVEVAGDSFPALGTGDFTIEAFVYFNDGTSNTWYDTRPSGVQGAYPSVRVGSNAFRYYVNSADQITGDAKSTSTWYHVAVVRYNGSTKLYVDGTQEGSTYSDSNNYLTTTNRPRLGNRSGTGFNGFIDELRVTKGVARYTSNFTPPSQTFSNK